MIDNATIDNIFDTMLPIICLTTFIKLSNTTIDGQGDVV